MPARPTKKAPSNVKPITAFFHRVSSQPSSRVSSSRVPSLDGHNTSPSQNSRKDSLSSGPVDTSSKASIAVVDSKATAVRTRARTSAGRAEADGVSASSSSSQAATSSSSNRVSGSSKVNGLKSKTLGSKKNKFDSDSDVDIADSVIYISKVPLQSTNLLNTVPSISKPREGSAITALPRKKPRLASPDVDDVTYSQSSDGTGTPMAKLVIERKPTLTPSSSLPSRGHPITPPLSSPDATKSSILLAQPSSPLTEPTLLSRTSTPVALDPESKAALIIADIKAKALAASMLSPPDSPVAEFKEELDESSDEDEGDVMLWPPEKGTDGQSMDKPIMLSPCKISPSQPATRYSLRSTSASTSSSIAPSLAYCKIQVEDEPVFSKKRSRISNPLDALLKEKNQADRTGKGAEAFSRAESAVASMFLSSATPEDEWASEEAAMKAVVQGQEMLLDQDHEELDDNGDLSLDEEDRQRLFGEKAGRKISEIINVEKVRQQQRVTIVGIALWEAQRSEDMDVDVLVPSSPPSGNDSVIDLINTCIIEQGDQRIDILVSLDADPQEDLARAAALLGSNAIRYDSLVMQPLLISWLCDLALMPDTNPLTMAAFYFLCNAWACSPIPIPTISFQRVLSILIQLGARKSVLTRLGWDTSTPRSIRGIDSQTREDILYRLTTFITASARTNRISEEDIPAMVLVLLIIASDQSCTSELQSDVMVAVDGLCLAVEPLAKLSPIVESAICNKVLQFISNIDIPVKAHILSVLGGGGERSRRIAKWVAYAIIVDQDSIPSEAYGPHPPLLSILDQLTRKNERAGQLGKFEIHEETDYVELRLLVKILMTAISNTSDNVTNHKMTMPRNSISGTHKDSSDVSAISVLERTHQALETLHSSISDVRAVDLERSRTKAVLKVLSILVSYQTGRSSFEGKRTSRGLKSFF